jgi:hypothetical protein
MATSTNAAIVKASGRDLCDVTGGGSRSDTLGSPALRASEQPLERCDDRAFCDTHTVTKFMRGSKRFRLIDIGFVGGNLSRLKRTGEEKQSRTDGSCRDGAQQCCARTNTARFLFSLVARRLRLRVLRSRTLCGLFRRVARVQARSGGRATREREFRWLPIVWGTC